MEKSCGKKPTNISQELDDMSNTEAIHFNCKTWKSSKYERN